MLKCNIDRESVTYPEEDRFVRLCEDMGVGSEFVIALNEAIARLRFELHNSICYA